jgi:hypothetical protein
MVSSLTAKRLIGCVLILHLAHAPIPFSDGVEHEPHKSVSQPAGRWDVDFILLGTDPPDDVDDGPVDDDPETCYDSFGLCYILPGKGPAKARPGLAPSLGIIETDCVLAGVVSEIRRVQPVAARLPHSFGATFSMREPRAWREFLSLLLL